MIKPEQLEEFERVNTECYQGKSQKKAYLLTFYTAKQGDSVVLLQASHNPVSKQFADLDSAVVYLKHQICNGEE